MCATNVYSFYHIVFSDLRLPANTSEPAGSPLNLSHCSSKCPSCLFSCYHKKEAWLTCYLGIWGHSEAVSYGKTVYKWAPHSAGMDRFCTICAVAFMFLWRDFNFVVVLFSNPETLNLLLWKINVWRVKTALMIIF